MAADHHFGPIPPYGVAIREAMASGDSSRSRAVIDAAKRWLQDNPGHEKQGEVHAALREAETNS
ncbi:DUF1843 domain-containing protein [Longimicrobium sp.]|uniref:DUF1843 domain-containing protein n=1 Tax=Longimicrobium sp. TaxID=2029185 RepID=UPI002E2ED78C|nr:DUF1843 domain-containing protein [Longimicrobium sp.]HEX6041145.1 DUF1843 domain-containing protein [Longimicrobium sp.]